MKKQKKIPSYVKSTWQYRSWVVFGMFAASYFFLQFLQAGALVEDGNASWSLVWYAGFVLMTVRLWALRRVWKKQNDASSTM